MVWQGTDAKLLPEPMTTNVMDFHLQPVFSVSSSWHNPQIFVINEIICLQAQCHSILGSSQHLRGRGMTSHDGSSLVDNNGQKYDWWTHKWLTYFQILFQLIPLEVFNEVIKYSSCKSGIQIHIFKSMPHNLWLCCISTTSKALPMSICAYNMQFIGSISSFISARPKATEGHTLQISVVILTPTLWPPIGWPLAQFWHILVMSGLEE